MPFSLLESIKNSIKGTFTEAINYGKKHPFRAVAAGVGIVIAGTVAPALLGVVAGVAAVGVVAKTVKNVAQDYAVANPDSRFAKFASGVSKVANIVKSVAKSVGNIGSTIKNNKWKAFAVGAGIVILGVATGGTALPLIAVGALAVGGAVKIGMDVRKDLKNQAENKNNVVESTVEDKVQLFEKERMKEQDKATTQETERLNDKSIAKSTKQTRTKSDSFRNIFTRQPKPIVSATYNAKKQEVNVGMSK
jgi:hypothetical protein